jgi:hypothetical protein
MIKIDRLKRTAAIKGSASKWNKIWEKLNYLYDDVQSECALCDYAVEADKPSAMRVCSYCPLGYHFEGCGDKISQFTNITNQFWKLIDDVDSFRQHIENLSDKEELYGKKKARTPKANR